MPAKGQRLSEETKLKISKSLTGHLVSEEVRKKISDGVKKNPVRFWKGKKFSKKHKKNLSTAHKGQFVSEETRAKKRGRPAWNKGKHFLRGTKHWNWQGGLTEKNLALRGLIEYKLWRKAVFERDDFTCQICRIRGVELQADHIKPFAYFPELRFDLSNGRTLCKKCHRATDTWGEKAKQYVQS